MHVVLSSSMQIFPKIQQLIPYISELISISNVFMKVISISLLVVYIFHRPLTLFDFNKSPPLGQIRVWIGIRYIGSTMSTFIFDRFQPPYTIMFAPLCLPSLPLLSTSGATFGSCGDNLDKKSPPPPPAFLLIFRLLLQSTVYTRCLLLVWFDLVWLLKQKISYFKNLWFDKSCAWRVYYLKNEHLFHTL